jgi:hypothetical protein
LSRRRWPVLGTTLHQRLDGADEHRRNITHQRRDGPVFTSGDALRPCPRPREGSRPGDAFTCRQSRRGCGSSPGESRRPALSPNRRA